MLFKAGQIITVHEARKLLSDEAEGMSDQDIEQMIQDFDVIAQYTVKLVQEFKDNKNLTDI